MKYVIDKATLTNIADKIRAKTGTTSTIKVSELANNIEEIPSINNQDKTITENGEYKADDGYTGLGTVTVDVPTPTPTLQDKEIEITENGTTEVTYDDGYDGINKVEITTNVSGGSGNPYAGSFDKEGLEYLGYDDDTIELHNAFAPWVKDLDDEMKLTDYDKSMKENITSLSDVATYANTLKYMPYIDTSSEATLLDIFQNCRNLMTIPKLDFSNVASAIHAFDSCYNLQILPEIDISNATTANYMFVYCYSLKYIQKINITKVNSMQNMFDYCYSLKEIPELDTSKVASCSYMFRYCYSLKKVPELDMTKATYINPMFGNCYSLTDLGGLKNLGRAYSTSQSANYTRYVLDLNACSLLTHDSLMNVINDLYDIATRGCNTQSLVLGDINLAKLTSDEIAIATAKRFFSFIERRYNMQFISYTKPKMIICEEGKQIRSKNDVYEKEHTDEEGNLVPEHTPHYSTTIFVPDNFTEEMMNELYVEE